MSRLDELADMWLEGSGTAADLEELRSLLEEPAQADAFLRRCGLEAELRRQLLGRETPLQLPSMRASAWRRIAVLTIAAMLLVALMLPLLPFLPTGTSAAPAPRLLVDSGQVQVDGEMVDGQRRLTPGTRLHSGHAARARILIPSVGTLSLDPDTALHLRGARDLRLDLGAIDVDALPQAADSPLLVYTPHAVCQVLGTRFRVQVTGSVSQVTVSSGRVLWQPRDAQGREVGPGEQAQAGSGISLRLDFTGAGQQASGLPEPMRIVGDAPLQFTGTGLLVGREEFVRSENPPAPPRPALLAALQAADQVHLKARVRFRHQTPPDLSLLTLMCQAAPNKADRYVPLRWRGEPAPAADRWYTVSRVYHRDGLVVSHIDAQVVERSQREWPFSDWTPIIQLLVHGHQDDAGTPIDIEYAWIEIQAR